MSRITATAEDAAIVPYHATGGSVAGLTRRLFKLRNLKLRRRTAPRELPELTDAWFEETIREVDEASARLQQAKSALRQISDAA